MDRRDKLLHGIDISTKTGLEIGALCRPFLKRGECDVIYVDHADTATLREKYRGDPNVNVDEIVDVDAVWGEHTLAQSVDRKVDYVVGSHVVEHVPDLIGWLDELKSALSDGGEVRLIVPDKRFTFDYLRHETRLPDVAYASLIKARKPQPHVVFDYIMSVVKLDGGLAWRGTLNPENLEHHHDLDLAQRCAMSVLQHDQYHDVHCWVFTPKSFALLFADLAATELMSFECTSFFDTVPYTNEFFVGLRPTDDVRLAEKSWREMAASVKHVATEPPQVEPQHVSLVRRLLHGYLRPQGTRPVAHPGS